MALKASTVEDVRVVAAATELARCVHRMRCAAFNLPDTEWPGLTEGQKAMFVEHAHALLMRLQPLASVRVVTTGLGGVVIGGINVDRTC